MWNEKMKKAMADLTPRTNAWNNRNPDPMHREYLRKKGLVVLSDGQAVPQEESGKMKRGRKAGTCPVCKVCGEPGHYAKTCKKLKERGLSWE